jgi:hypothetical protein
MVPVSFMYRPIGAIHTLMLNVCHKQIYWLVIIGTVDPGVSFPIRLLTYFKVLSEDC